MKRTIALFAALPLMLPNLYLGVTGFPQNITADYKIVRPEGCSMKIVTAANNLKKNIEKSTGISLEVITDKTEKYAAGAMIPHEILVGNTNRDEYDTLYSGLRSDDYRISSRDGQIIIAAGSEAAYADAVKYVSDSFISGNKFRVPANFEKQVVGEYDFGELVLDGKNISEYTLVFENQKAKACAEAFAAKCLDVTGYSLGISESAGGASIVFGSGNGLKPYEYEISKKDGNIYVSSPSGEGLNNAARIFSENVFAKTESPAGEKTTVEVKSLSDSIDKTYEYENYIIPRDGLANTYKKLTQDKSLRVAYFGGSVTVGYGASDNSKYSWRARTTAWLKDNFPDASITEIFAAIGATGSHLGAFRVGEDVIAQNPDLVFIEFSINDAYDGESYATASEYYESIVRQIRRALPECDIVNVYVTDSSRTATGERLSTQAKAHDDVAEAYGIPAILVGKALTDKYGLHSSADALWKKYFLDIVHMTDEGYNEYFKTISEYLKNALMFGENKGEPGKKDLPKAVNEGADRPITLIVPTKEMTESGKGFTYNPNAFATVGTVAHKGFIENRAENKDNYFEMKFTGTEIAAWLNCNAGTFRVTVDDKTSTVTRNSQNNPMVLARNLAPGEHTLGIKVMLTDKSVTYCTIGAFLVR